MKFKLFFIVFSVILLAGCSQKCPPPKNTNYNAYDALTEAAQTSSQSMTQLSATEQAAYPPQTVAEPPNPATYGMAKPISITWNGPIEPLIKKIANNTGYTMRVLGNKPPIPVLVNINAQYTPVGNVLRDASYQAGSKANVVVYPKSKVIEIRYAHS